MTNSDNKIDVEQYFAKVLGELLDKCGVEFTEEVVDRYWQYRDDAVKTLADFQKKRVIEKLYQAYRKGQESPVPTGDPCLDCGSKTFLYDNAYRCIYCGVFKELRSK